MNENQTPTPVKFAWGNVNDLINKERENGTINIAIDAGNNKAKLAIDKANVEGVVERYELGVGSVDVDLKNDNPPDPVTNKINADTLVGIDGDKYALKTDFGESGNITVNHAVNADNLGKRPAADYVTKAELSGNVSNITVDKAANAEHAADADKLGGMLAKDYALKSDLAKHYFTMELNEDKTILTITADTQYDDPEEPKGEIKNGKNN